MFERFDAGARRATVQAQEEARAHRWASIEPGHVLLGILRAPDDPGVVRSLGPLVASIAHLADEVDEAVPRGTGPTTDHIPFSAASKDVLLGAAVLARDLGVRHIGTEHLLGAVAGADDPSVGVLARHGAGRDALLAAIRDGSSGPGFRVRTTRGLGRFRLSGSND